MAHPAAVLVERVKQAYKADQIMLPELPEVALRVREAIRGEDVNVLQIAKLIQMDPAITARLLQIANSPLHRSASPIQDCRSAITRLGLKITQDIVTCLAMQKVFAGASAQILQQVRHIWEHSCRVAAFSYVLARVTPGLNEDKAMLAGLIHDIGVLPVLYYAADEPQILAQPQMLQAVIKAMRGVLGKAILKKWRFDNDLVVIPENAEDWQRQHGGRFDYSDVVILAQLHSFFGAPDAQALPRLAEVPAFQRHGLYQLGPDASLELIDEADEEISSIVRMLNNTAR
ncbi:MAG: HDOD domain-containing protein [Gammaproteobacteria bacterium]